MQTKEEAQLALEELNMLLDKNLEDVADLPEYLDKIPPGFYKLTILEAEFKSVEVPKEKGSQEKISAPVLQFVYEVKECLELQNEEDRGKLPKMDGTTPPRINESIFFHTNKETATSAVKTKFKEIAEQLKIGNLLELVRSLKGLDIGATVKCVEDNKKEDKFYIRVSNCRMM